MKEEVAQKILRKTKKDFNLIAQDFSRTRQNVWLEFNIFKDFIKEGDRVLDEGCGNGRMLDFLRDKKIDYTGIDFSEKILEIARRKYPSGKFVLGNILSLPFPDNYFDVVFLIAVLHHIPSQKLRLKALEESWRVLKPEGKIIVSVWDFLGRKKLIFLILKQFLRKILGKSEMDFRDVFVPWGKKAKRYYHFFTQREILKLMRRANFQIIQKGVSRDRRGRRANIYVIAQKPS